MTKSSCGPLGGHDVDELAPVGLTPEVVKPSVELHSLLYKNGTFSHFPIIFTTQTQSLPITMTSINNPSKDETYKRQGDDPSNTSRFRETEPFPGQYNPDTTGERVASHIPGTHPHTERTELPGRTANVLGTADYEHKREHQGHGLTNPADDAYAGTHHNTTAAEPFDRRTGNVPSTGAVEGTAPIRNEHGTKTEPRVSTGVTATDKVLGIAEKSLGKVMNKPAMVEKGIERQVSPKHML